MHHRPPTFVVAAEPSTITVARSSYYATTNVLRQGRNFFTGGSIISLNSYFHLLPTSLRLTEVQPVSGVGYSKTLLAWLDLMERQRTPFVRKYGRCD